jgi:hypothetical protein
VPQLADTLMVMHQGSLVECSRETALEALQSEAARRLWTATSRIAGGAL